MNGFYIFVAVASLISVLITFFLGRISRNRAFVKYIPAILAALAALGFLIKAKFFSTTEGFQELGYIVLMFISTIVFFISLITAIIIGIVQRNSRRNN